MKKFLELDAGFKVMILSKHKLEDKKYLFVVTVTEQPKFLFVQNCGDGNLSPVEDGETLSKLTLQVEKKLVACNKK